MGVAKSVFRYLFILIPFISIVPGFAAGERIIFEHLNTKDGLSNGTVNKTFRDSKGFIWICTEDGLNKYDGYTIKVYQPTVNNKKRNSQFKDVTEDRFGRIWFATTYGLFFYNSAIDDIALLNSVVKSEIESVLTNGLVLCLHIDKNDNLWIGTYNGLYKIKLRDSVFSNINLSDTEYFLNNPNDPGSISDNNIISIDEDTNGKIWFSNYSNYLDSYEALQNNFSHHPLAIPGFFNSPRLNKKITIDNRNKIWVFSDGQGVHIFDPLKSGFEEVRLFDHEGRRVNTSIVMSVIFDSKGRTWIGTDGNGIVIWDKNNNTLDHFKNDENDLSNLSSNGIYSLYEDFSGTIWVGTYLAGLNKVAKNKSIFGLITSSSASNRGLSNNLVNAFCEDHKGKIWIATDGGGVNVLDPVSFTFTHFKHDPNDPTSLSTNITNAVFEDSKRNIWVGTYNGGLNRYNRETKKFDHFWPDLNDNTTISSKHPWRLAQDKYENIWIATINNGLNLLKPGSDKFIQYRKINDTINTPDFICSNALNYLFIDSKNNLWICTEYGLDRVNLGEVNFNADRPQITFNHYWQIPDSNSISTNRVSYITEDKEGNMWIGTNGAGLNKLDIKTGRFTYYNVNNGLPHNIIQGILFDKDENLWISTNNGLSKFDRKKEVFVNFGQTDGLQSAEFTKTSCMKTKGGMMFFGGVNGFNAFYPEKIVPNKFVPNVVITDFKLFNKPIGIGEKFNKRVILPKSISELKVLALSHNDNFLSFEFAALDFYSPEKNRYSYKMEGFDDDWRFTDASNRTATYTNLNPGSYTFRVKASNNEGIWNEKGTSIKIIIYPPWWQTWWFRLISFFSIASILILFYFYRVSALNKQKRILEEMVAERTMQLQTANAELKELNATKDKFVSIIAHDILNPFNTILGFSELLIENFSNWKDEEKLKTANLIFNSSKRLFDLLENLLAWSRSERGLLKMLPKDFELIAAIKKTTSILRFSALAKNIQLIETSSDEKIMVYSDPNIIHTINRNLISNAIKFTPQGGTIKIEIKVSNKFAVVSIIDNGVGIPEENIENLFRIDVHHTTVGTNDEKGTGLGLMLVRDFVSKQGGELSIISNVGEGSTFSFTVPLAKHNS